jgi:lipopolysaccharide/colanic/teichoic acid biosynthesis glycosyltransferase
VGDLCRRLPLYRARHAVKPGLTGWAQIRYRYGDTVEGARIKLEYDMYYVKHANLILDLLIILQTLRVILRLRGK